jgi:hypothetical protein
VGNIRPRHQPGVRSYPSAIAEAFWQLARSGKLGTALPNSLRPFWATGCHFIGVPVG